MSFRSKEHSFDEVLFRSSVARSSVSRSSVVRLTMVAPNYKAKGTKIYFLFLLKTFKQLKNCKRFYIEKTFLYTVNIGTFKEGSGRQIA